MFIGWRSRLHLYPMSFSVYAEEDGIDWIKRDDGGTRFQLVADRLLREEPARLTLRAWMEPLNEWDASSRASWYVRRDRWTWFFKVIWRGLTALEDREAQLLIRLFVLRHKDLYAGRLIQWRALLL